MSKSLRTVLVLSAASIPFLVGGCPWLPPPGGGAGDGEPALTRFTSGEELLNYFKQQATAQQTRSTGLFGLGGAVGLAPGAAQEDSGALAADGAATGGESNEADSYSTTNLQEAGVDESDIFKSDGTRFYIAKGQTLRVVNATPLTELEEVACVEFEVPIEALYLYESKIIALGQRYSFGGGDGPEILMWPPYYTGASVLVYEVDVSDPSAPEIVGQNELDGSLASSRLTNGRLILILTIAPPLPANPNPLSIGLMSLDQVLPTMRIGDAEQVLVAPEDWFHPESPDGYFTTAVVTLDAEDVETVVGSVAVMANAGTIYASTEALYLTDTQYDSASGYRERTAIHKLAFNDQGVAEYVGSGSVPGRLLNQFSLGEYEGYLRVATHVTNWRLFGDGVGIAVAEAGAGDDGEVVDSEADSPADDEDDASPTVVPTGPYNAVYVLGESAGTLEIAGSIENIAPGEQLYAARFMGPRGYLVTFVRIDPLFVLDLSDPASPSVLGELKIPGYSDYLHPFGDDLLIGVGRSTREMEWGGPVPSAVQVSLFDVSDPANPTTIHQLEIGGYGSTSDVSYTHKAFTFLPDEGLLALPVQLWAEEADSSWQWARDYQCEFEGVLCLTVDATEGFSELGRVASVVYQELGWTEWRRGAFIGDVLYALTPAGVRAAELGDFDNPTTLALTPSVGEFDGSPGQPQPDGGGGQAEPGWEGDE
uniref:Beta propeller domain protein n=1 Tax=uncultured Planctomycetota bacterium TaxID=120965 RepID=A0A5B8KHW2_9BACT|nr:hypothetical protein fos2004AM_00003 [uncultured Planctomycetota bacterium]